jgi:hypothetical protein
MSKSGLCLASAVALLTVVPAGAHHSYVEFDQQQTIEIEGTLVAALWQNPHSRFTVAAADGMRWDIESSSVNGLRRTGAPLELYAVGTKVKVAVATVASGTSAKTIFRSWGSAYARPGVPDDPDASPASLWRVPLPLTDAASRALAGFDAVRFNMTMGCAPKGMPSVMSVPAVTDFVDRGATILLRIEEFDVVTAAVSTTRSS